MAKRQPNKTFLVIIAALFISNMVMLVLSFAISTKVQQETIVGNQPEVQKALQATNSISILSLEGFVKAEIDLRQNLLLVKNGCKGIPMTPSEQQIRSISSVLNNQTDFRPSTHDLMSEVFNTYGIEVLQTKIVDVDEGEDIYYARLIVKQGDKILT